MIRKSTALHFLPLLILAGSLVGCSSNNNFADIKAKMKEIQAKPHGSIKPPPEFKPAEAFTYSANQLRSPFTPPQGSLPLFVGNGKQVQPDLSRPKEYLEHFNLDALRMVGTITKADSPLEALIQDPDGKITRVRTGEYMGKNYGKIVEITGDSISVMEIVPDGRDGWVQRPRTLKLSTASNS
jgi:type IV pilus assembly protein PilP